MNACAARLWRRQEKLYKGKRPRLRFVLFLPDINVARTRQYQLERSDCENHPEASENLNAKLLNVLRFIFWAKRCLIRIARFNTIDMIDIRRNRGRARLFDIAGRDKLADQSSETKNKAAKNTGWQPAQQQRSQGGRIGERLIRRIRHALPLPVTNFSAKE